MSSTAPTIKRPKNNKSYGGGRRSKDRNEILPKGSDRPKKRRRPGRGDR